MGISSPKSWAASNQEIEHREEIRCSICSRSVSRGEGVVYNPHSTFGHLVLRFRS